MKLKKRKGNLQPFSCGSTAMRTLRFKAEAVLSCILLIVSQWLGILTGCAPEAQTAFATSIGDVVDVVTTSGSLGSSIYIHVDSTNSRPIVCLERGIDRGDGTAYVKDLLNQTTRRVEGGEIFEITWSQQAVTEAALIYDYAYERFNGDAAYIVAQSYVWAYQLAGLNLDGMASKLDYVHRDYRHLCAEIASYVREKSASKIGYGYLYSKTNGDQQLAYFWSEELTGGLELHKSSSNAQVSANNGCYSLEGAEYGLYSDEGCKNLVITLRCDRNGNAKAEGIIRGSYFLREDKAAPGFARDTEVRPVEVPAGAVKSVDVSDVPQTCTVEVAVKKTDAESGKAEPKGAATLANAEFRVDYYAGDYGLDNLPENPSQTYTVTTGDDGTGRLGRELPLGCVVIRETKAPTGYVLDPTPRLVKITAAGETAKVETYNAPTVGNRVIRANLSFVKADEDTQRRMANVAFRLTSKTTGESHVLVTDENGCFDSAEPAHSSNTNAADAALSSDGKTVDSSKLIVCGTWFGGGAPNDSVGALPYDTYELQELRCKANEGHRLVSTTLTISRDGKTYHLGTFDDKEPAIATTLAYADGEKVCPAAEVELTDTVRYEGLERGHAYRLVGELHDFDENGRDLGVVAKAQIEFTPQLAAGDQKVTFTVDASKLGGHRLVAYESVYDGDDLLSEHADATDEAQTVRIPKISTELSGNAGHEADATAETITLTDAVTYTNLEPGRTYTVRGTLHLKGEDGSDEGVALDDAGEPIVAESEFTPEKGCGTVELTFTFTGAHLVGRDVVAFEEVSKEQVTYAVHADIEDKSQTVDFPALATTATGTQTADHDIAAAADQKVVDTVAITNVQAGAEYELRGSLHLVGEDGSDEGVVAKKSLSFTAEAADTEVELEFTVDATKLAGRTLVAFEELYRAGARVGSHADLNDEAQSIHVPVIETTLTDYAGAKELVVAGDPCPVTLTDTVAFRNLLPGKTYQLKGALHLKGADGSDAGVLTTTDGKAVEAEAEFTPESADGEAKVTFELDAAKLAGKTVVAFEELYAGEAKLADHADIADAAQAFFFKENPPVETPPAEEPPAQTPPAGTVPKTGDSALPVFVCTALGGLLAFCALAIVHAGSMRAEDK